MDGGGLSEDGVLAHGLLGASRGSSSRGRLIGGIVVYLLHVI